MQTITYPPQSQWATIVRRPRIDAGKLHGVVAEILQDVRTNGDKAVRLYSERFDHVSPQSLLVGKDELDEAERLVSSDLKEAMSLAHANIKSFHEAQVFRSTVVTTTEGVDCWQKSVPIQRVGLYVPGGTAPLFSTVLMLAIPATIAGCEEIVLCTPPGTDGKVNPAIIVAACMAGVSKIFKVGGVQAIGAMAYGTESIPKVYKIFGPGNQYVMEAKQQVSIRDVAIDMPAGPSEVCVIADDSANAAFVAADLLSQAEHGVDSQVVLITTSRKLLGEVEDEMSMQMDALPRKNIVAKALDNSMMILVNNVEEAMALANMYAPEHLVIQTKDYERLAGMVTNAGSVFLGKYACESAGDYASGTNHTLPTNGYAKAYSGVSLDSFCKKITFQHISADGIRKIGPAVETMATAECLEAHRNAMTLRLKSIQRAAEE